MIKAPGFTTFIRGFTIAQQPTRHPEYFLGTTEQAPGAYQSEEMIVLVHRSSRAQTSATRS